MDDYNEDEFDKEESYNDKERILFVLDCSPSMFETDTTGNIPVQSAMKCIYNIFLNMVISSNSDTAGVVLYGTGQTNNQDDLDHIYVLQGFDVPDAQVLKDFENMAKGTIDIKKKFGSTNDEVPMGNVFKTCSDLFGNSTKIMSQRIFLITNNDHPHAENAALQTSAVKRAKDLFDTGIHIELFGLNKPHHVFDEMLFYNEILSQDTDPRGDAAGRLDAKGDRAAVTLEDLLDRVKRKQAKKRPMFRVPFHVAEDLTIGVVGYAMVKEQKKSTHKWVTTTSERLEQAVSTTTYTCVDTNEPLLPSDIQYYYSYGGEKIVFTKDEMEKLHHFGDPGLVLIGFKNESELKTYYNVTNSYFIYPDETQYIGSTRLFSALLQAQAKEKSIAICSFIRRNNALPKFVALYPQLEVLDYNGVQKRPPGFHVVILPFADDIREVPETMTVTASDELTDANKDVIENLMIPCGFDPSDYENPDIKRHFSTIQAIALDNPIEDIEDSTIPPYATIEKFAGKEIATLKSLLPSPEYEKEAPVASRTKDTDKAVNAAVGVEAQYHANNLKQCTIPVLKEWLKNNGVVPKQRKADLIEQVTEIMDKKTTK